MNGAINVMRRELTGYFATPIAYVFLIIFLVMTGVFTFYLGNFYQRGIADLDPFFRHFIERTGNISKFVLRVHGNVYVGFPAAEPPDPQLEGREGASN